MCLIDFIETKQIEKNEAIIGYRNWLNLTGNSLLLKSLYQDYTWNSKNEGPHLIKKENSGIYSRNNNYYNNNNNYYYNHNYYNHNYNNHNYNNNNYYNYYNNYYYNIGGIIHQYGTVAIHLEGYRSEFAEIQTIFSIRESDAKGPRGFLNWIKIFNEKINQIAQKYEVNVISWQDFIESQKS